ncbi:hypothetical protein G1H10_23405 [Phytoactinopolyspora halotolerans]|uniref:Uncharacterized protein n=1 Tax=Phytoactinopolyspora halotolerans TaxID=1981512 RepID=A0A6L9SD12_9ACTN|nr:hypothetical protein [Phytoactinopolyspora halotolerans]
MCLAQQRVGPFAGFVEPSGIDVGEDAVEAHRVLAQLLDVRFRNDGARSVPARPQQLRHLLGGAPSAVFAA